MDSKSIDENIRYIGIANLVEEKIVVDYCPVIKKDKLEDVIILILIN